MAMNLLIDVQAQRFNAYVYHEPNTGCWLWGGGVSKSGYGVFCASAAKGDRMKDSAHRIAWATANKTAPAKGMSVCHKCDVKTCVNPDHLFLGTPKENTADMFRKGRWVQPSRNNPAKGETHGSKTKPHCVLRGEVHAGAKLSEADVLAVRASHRTLTDEALVHGVTPQAIYRIRNRLTWKHI